MKLYEKIFVPCVSFAIQEIDLSSIDRHPLHDPSTENRIYLRLEMTYLSSFQMLLSSIITNIKRTFSSSITSRTAEAIAQLTGLPPKVLKYSIPVLKNESATALVVITAATGCPFP